MKKYLTRNNILYFLGSIILGVLIVLIARITYAYMAPTFEDAYSNVKLESDTVDEFKFEGGTEPLSIEATSTTLAEGGSNIVKTSTAKAKLKASSSRAKNTNADDDTAIYSYYVYINIPNNTFTYIKDTNPELILQVSVDGVEITNITDLTYGTFNGISGFDVTTLEGNYLVAQKTITSTSSTEFTEQNWEFKLIYINQNYDQSANYGHEMNFEIRMKKEEMVYLANYIKGLYKADGTGEPGLYYHNGTITTTSLGIDENNTVLDANDSSYRYAGKNPNNYVCFGYDDPDKTYASNWCPYDNLYRIIGVFNMTNVSTNETEERVKLIKAYEAGENVLGKAPDAMETPHATYYGGNLTEIPGYYWTGSGENKINSWSSSTLNTEILNGTYLTKLGKNIGRIATTRWQVGGAAYGEVIGTTPSVAYQNEVGTPVKDLTYDSKVGLMYISDYGFAASPENWTTKLNGYNTDTNRNNNWMFSGMNEWTITRRTTDNQFAFYPLNTGNANGYYVTNKFAVRPAFNLKSWISYVGGTGTKDDPIRIN